MKKKTLIIIIAIVLVTAALVTVHLFQDKVNPENAVTLISGKTEKLISIDKLKKNEFSGTITNGKGEKTEASFKGVELRELLEQNGFDLKDTKSIEAVAQDQFSAKLTADEIKTAGKVYIAVEKGGKTLPGLKKDTNGAQLIVFGDKDSKRCVSYLEKIILYDEAK